MLSQALNENYYLILNWVLCWPFFLFFYDLLPLKKKQTVKTTTLTTEGTISESNFACEFSLQTLTKSCSFLLLLLHTNMKRRHSQVMGLSGWSDWSTFIEEEEVKEEGGLPAQGRRCLESPPVLGLNWLNKAKIADQNGVQSEKEKGNQRFSSKYELERKRNEIQVELKLVRLSWTCIMLVCIITTTHCTMSRRTDGLLSVTNRPSDSQRFTAPARGVRESTMMAQHW